MTLFLAFYKKIIIIVFMGEKIMLENFKKKYVADKYFYTKVAKISVPIALQQILNQSASFVDTIMVSRIGAVAAVSVATQLDTLCNTVSFGVNSGASMYSAQFYGAKDSEGLKKVFGLQLILNTLNALIFLSIALLFGYQVLHFYSSDQDVIAVGMQYLRFSCFTYFFSVITNTYSFIYRSIQKTHIPMYIGISVTLINVLLNYVFIFGHLGMPKMGAAGAALATLIATMSGTICHIVYAYFTSQPFIGSFKEMFYLPIHFVQPIIKRMLPLIVNETLFGFGTSMYIKAYGILGKSSLEIYKIGNTVSNFFYIGVQGLNSATGLVIGEQLGKKRLDVAKQYGSYLVLIAVILAFTLTGALYISAKPLVNLFGLEDPLMYQGAIVMVRLFGLRIATRLFNVIIMSSLRAGGDSVFLMFLDCGIMWSVGIPLAFISVCYLHVTSLSLLFIIIQIEQVTRLIVGFTRYKQGKWIRNLTQETK